MTQEYTLIARFRQPPWPDGKRTIIEIRQYGAEVARCVNGWIQDHTSWGVYGLPVVPIVQEWVDFERKIGSEMEQWVKLT